MPEGPINVEPRPVDAEVETEAVAESAGTGLPAQIEVPPGTTAHFPAQKPRLHAGGLATLKALRGH